MSMATTYLYLAIAIIAEVIATSALKASDGFSRLLPSVITVIGYGIAFWCLSLTLKSFQPVSSMPSGRAWASC